jgi:hypothetical protein
MPVFEQYRSRRKERFILDPRVRICAKCRAKVREVFNAGKPRDRYGCGDEESDTSEENEGEFGRRAGSDDEETWIRDITTRESIMAKLEKSALYC